ncbi:prepilin-type N-terminal cleavage/methylation domain-containing protein [Virgibacillus halodenitrificans]|nr:prepilin-type N-terminal cleavage/methylation domain-containing protein [Virgibacillus halodenitrificans]
MYTKFKQMNSSGFTLIEIIASITILGVVIAALLPIFPQIFSWTKMTEDELSSSNLLGKVAQDIEDEGLVSVEQLPTCPTTESLENFAKNTPSKEGPYSVDVAVCQSEEEVALDLIRAHIQILQGGKKISESYTYITGDDS